MNIKKQITVTVFEFPENTDEWSNLPKKFNILAKRWNAQTDKFEWRKFEDCRVSYPYGYRSARIENISNEWRQVFWYVDPRIEEILDQESVVKKYRKCLLKI
jgi:hypothetical protein